MTDKNIELGRKIDGRGVLDFLELDNNFPFVPKRIFTIRLSDSTLSRGNHAHRECHQFLFPVVGSCKMLLINSDGSREIQLIEGEFGVWVEPFNWVSLFDFSEDCCVLVLASHAYDPDDYIHSLEDLRAHFTSPFSEDTK